MNEQHASTKIVSWNMNGGVSHRIPLNEELCWRGNILCIQEHLLTSDSLSLLKFSDNHTFYFVPAKSRQRGRPSGGLTIVCSSAVDSESLHTAENFMFIRAGNLVIVNVYLPTNYSNDESDNRFSKAVRALAECLNTIMLSKTGMCYNWRLQLWSSRRLVSLVPVDPKHIGKSVLCASKRQWFYFHTH